jgi:ubiquinone/menaquinone biosynthesis C-methylase UbiE
MDHDTIKAYNAQAEEISSCHATFRPVRIYALAQKYFWPQNPTLDLGCGTGRDSAWLQEQGFPTLGVDASSEMLKVARTKCPAVEFKEDSLPELSTIPDNAYRNVLCSAVLMHLSRAELPLAITHILRILRPTGRLLLSFRPTVSPDGREKGKLYEPIDPQALGQLFNAGGAQVLHQEKDFEPCRGHLWHNIIVEKGR